jgi:hypothetical protein
VGLSRSPFGVPGLIGERAGDCSLRGVWKGVLTRLGVALRMVGITEGDLGLACAMIVGVKEYCEEGRMISISLGDSVADRSAGDSGIVSGGQVDSDGHGVRSGIWRTYHETCWIAAGSEGDMGEKGVVERDGGRGRERGGLGHQV